MPRLQLCADGRSPGLRFFRLWHPFPERFVPVGQRVRRCACTSMPLTVAGTAREYRKTIAGNGAGTRFPFHSPKGKPSCGVVYRLGVACQQKHATFGRRALGLPREALRLRADHQLLIIQFLLELPFCLVIDLSARCHISHGLPFCPQQLQAQGQIHTCMAQCPVTIQRRNARRFILLFQPAVIQLIEAVYHLLPQGFICGTLPLRLSQCCALWVGRRRAACALL